MNSCLAIENGNANLDAGCQGWARKQYRCSLSARRPEKSFGRGRTYYLSVIETYRHLSCKVGASPSTNCICMAVIVTCRSFMHVALTLLSSPTIKAKLLRQTRKGREKYHEQNRVCPSP